MILLLLRLTPNYLKTAIELFAGLGKNNPPYHRSWSCCELSCPRSITDLNMTSQRLLLYGAESGKSKIAMILGHNKIHRQNIVLLHANFGQHLPPGQIRVFPCQQRLLGNQPSLVLQPNWIGLRPACGACCLPWTFLLTNFLGKHIPGFS